MFLDQFGKVVKSSSDTGAVNLLTDLDTVHFEFPH